MKILKPLMMTLAIAVTVFTSSPANAFRGGLDPLLVGEVIRELGTIRGEVDTFSHPASVNLDAWNALNRIYFQTNHKLTGIDPNAPQNPAGITAANLNDMAVLDEGFPGNGTTALRSNLAILENLYIELTSNRL